MKRKPAANSPKQVKKPMFPPSANKAVNTETETKKSDNERSEGKQTGEIPTHIIPCYDKKQRIMNRWNKWSIGFNAVMMLATVGIFWYSKKGIDAAAKSAQIADSTFREVKNEFATSNKPIIQIGRDIVFNTFEKGKKVTFTINIENLGKYPARIIRSKIYTAYNSFNEGYGVSYIFQYFKSMKSDTLNLKIAGGSAMPFTYTDKNILLGDYVYNGIKSGGLSLYILGEFDYFDRIENKTKTYRFMTQSAIFPKIISRIIVNIDDGD